MRRASIRSWQEIKPYPYNRRPSWSHGFGFACIPIVAAYTIAALAPTSVSKSEPSLVEIQLAVQLQQASAEFPQNRRFTTDELTALIVPFAKSKEAAKLAAKIAMRESSGNLDSSGDGGTSRGLFQMHNTPVADCVYCQIEQAQRYMERRYGNWSKAWAHHEKNGWW